VFVLEVVLDEVEPEPPKSLLMAEPAALVAALAAAVVADCAREFVSRLAIEPRAPSTEFALLLFTRLFEPEISPLRKSAGVLEVVDLLVRPLMLETRLTRFVRLVVFEKSSFPSDLYCL